MAAPEEPEVPKARCRDEEAADDISETVSPSEALEMLPTEKELEAEFD